MTDEKLRNLKKIIGSITYTGSFLRADGIMTKRFIDICSIPTLPGGINACTEVISELMEKVGCEKIATQSKSNNVYFATHVSQKTEKDLLMISVSEKINNKHILGRYAADENITIFYPLAHIYSLFSDMIGLLREEGLTVNTMVSLIKINEDIGEKLEKIGVNLISVFEFNRNTGYKLKVTNEYKKIMGV